MNRLMASLPATAAILLASLATARDSGIQLTPDGKRVLINKDVNGEEWVITRNLDDSTIVGNVISASGSPVFFWCSVGADNGTQTTLSCSTAATCTTTPCGSSQWKPLGNVQVADSFLVLPGSSPPTSSFSGHYQGTVLANGDERNANCHWLVSVNGTVMFDITTTDGTAHFAYTITEPQGFPNLQNYTCLPGTFTDTFDMPLTVDNTGTLTGFLGQRNNNTTFSGAVQGNTLTGTLKRDDAIDNFHFSGPVTAQRTQ